ncbi:MULTISPECIES: HD domain-containing protein [unclassified Ligilactobacillus]|uniref:HD domain-containing protein n=1 Tax=unclassified Ligilactobacillus TaxID=2767920 RepID=UPI003851D57A
MTLIYIADDVAALTKQVLGNDATGHDVYHAERVARNAVRLYQDDFPAASTTILRLIATMGYLHDVVDEKVTATPTTQWHQIMTLPTIRRFSHKNQEILHTTITHMSYAANLEHHFKLPVPGQYVQDADRLDALGAIGIARAFAYGGAHHQPIYDPTVPVVMSTNKETYRHHKETSINHFHEKLLHLEATMNTAAGKTMAHARTAYMQAFLTEFMREWNK